MDYENLILDARRAAEFLSLTTATLSYQRKAGCGPVYETVIEPGTSRLRYYYWLDDLANHLRVTKHIPAGEVERRVRKAITQQRLRLARAADRERMWAMTAIRQANRAREAAALAGHKPSIRIFEAGGF